MLYALARKALFATDPERAHEIALQSLLLGHHLGVTRWIGRGAALPVRCMGLQFPNPVGLAAGLDKNAAFFEALGDLGFGFIEVGTVTPRPQAGNPRPRIFRIPQAQALINRLGFNNNGIDQLVKRVRNHRFKGILGINIGKNFDTPMQHASADYVHCLEKIYPYADYVAINVSSPNTSQLRELQAESALDPLLEDIARARERLTEQHGRRLPIALKVAPDLDTAAIADIARTVAKHRMDAVIATNTTTSRDRVEGLEHAGQTGGLSGLPLKPLANRVLAAFRRQLDSDIALIGVGGINCGGDAVEKLELGADLVQVYTGLVYHGPALIRDCLSAIARQRPA